MSFFRMCRFACVALASLAAVVLAQAQQPGKANFLRIGAGPNLSADSDDRDNANNLLHSFVKSETGYDNKIIDEKSWSDVVEKLAGKQLELGVVQGYEFAWAREKNPKLAALAVAINDYPYRTIYLVVNKDSKTADFAGLKGQTVAVAKLGQGYTRLYVDKHARAAGQEADAYFAKISSPLTIEEALDEVVDGASGAAVVDKPGLEAYRRRKPGRASLLKEVSKSEPLPPPVIIYQDGDLDKTTVTKVRDGLLNAHKKKDGQRLLTIFRLTAFQTVPADLDKVLIETQKSYPAPK
jgi:ABC-type phosphate/phosphonate transport system substrate-binding protein